MNKIIADKETLSALKQAKPGDPSIYVNLDAINSLPEQFEPVVTKVKFDPKKDWVSVGNGNFMPDTWLVYEIAKAAGVSGYPEKNTAPVYMEVNVNEMEMIPGYNMVKIHVGYESTKQSKILMEDGTFFNSSPCTSLYSAWDRCIDAWANEEKYTEGYTKQGKFPPKYDTKYKRKADFAARLKFALKVAETQAFFKTIRELAGMKTGYKETDLRSGYMIFYRIRKSESMLKLEAAAHLDKIRNGGRSESQDLLFGGNEQKAIAHAPEPEPEQIEQITQEIEPEEIIQHAEPAESEELMTPAKLAENLNLLLATLADTPKDGETKSDLDICKAMIGWLNKNPDMSNVKNQEKFNKIINFHDENYIPF